MNRKALYATVGSALALALLTSSLPASAEVNISATINKFKDVDVFETIFITKTVELQIIVDLVYTSAAEADAILNQENTRNHVGPTEKQIQEGDEGETDPNNFGIDLEASINNSIILNTGIVDVNQDVGNMANQANQVALAIATPAPSVSEEDFPVLVHSQSEAEQINRNNSVLHGEDLSGDPDLTLVDPPHLTADITDSINGNIGIVNVNQNAGNMNNQANSEAIAVATNLSGVALSEAALGQVNTHTENSGSDLPPVFEFGVDKTATINGSLNGNVGVGGVNQAVGNMANQANIFSLSFVDSGGGVGLGQ